MKRSTVLGAWFLAFVTTFSTTRASSLPDMADLIIYNAKVLTVNSNFTVASAIAVKDDRILAVGTDRRLEEFRGPETRIVDAQGRTIMPGLYDADQGSYVAAISELKRPVPDIDSITNAQAYIRREASNTPAGKWITLDFILPTRLKEGRLPTKEELDAATTNVPVLWIFGPNAVVNSKALEVSKIDKDTEEPAGGEIVKEPRHHKPTGLLRNALSVLKLPKPDQPPTTAQERAALKHLYALYNEQGITSIGELCVSPAAIDLFREMAHSNELTVRINCGRYFSPSKDADESIDRLAAFTNAPAGKQPYGPTGVGDDWVRMGPLETEIDGNAGMGTAYLRTPYGIGPTFMINELAYRGRLLQDAFALPQVYLAAAQQGWQLETHAAGDAALDFLLNAYQQVQFKFDIKNKRFLIAHSEFQAAQDWRRCQDLGVGVILRPAFLYDDGANLEKTLGTNRLTYYLPFKSWFDKNIVAGGGSGHVVGLDSKNSPQAWNPWLAIWVTLTRQTTDGGEINPQEKLTREQAIRLYTYNNAWLHNEDKQKGSLEPGKLADLVMLDTDIMKCPVDEILNTKVLLTLVNGKAVWQSVEPIFPGPQVISAVTVNAPLNVVAPVVPAVVNNQSAAAAAKHAAQGTTGINPYAPVLDSSPAPVNAMAPLPMTTASNAAPALATTGQSVSATNSTTSAPTTSTTGAAPATQTSEAKPDTTASTEAVSGIAGAAPAEVAANQTSASTSTVTTNQAPSAPATNAVPSATTTNAANSVAAPTQVATATMTSSSAPDATVAIPAAAVSATAQAPSTASDTSATATQAAPSSATATPTQVATATAPAPAATARATPRSLPPLDWLTPPAPAATANATTSPSTTATNDAPASSSQDWSRISPGTK